MELVKITDLVSQLGLSSRSLRYYEQAGLIHSIRPEFEKYRFYDNANVERLKQIMVLRKMEIPIRDILRIYESTDMGVVVETFVDRIRAIDKEVDALTELRAVVDDFLQAMLQNGVTKISALPLLYEQMEKHLENLDRYKPETYAELSALSDKLAGPVNYAIIELPSMRVLTSGADTEGFHRWTQSRGLPQGRPGQHEQFELQDEILLRVAEGFENDGAYQERIFVGGLYAAANVHLDEDLGQRFRALVSGFDDNKYYGIDYDRESMLENLLSPDDKRELVSLLVPVKKRLANPALFDAPEEVTGISIIDIETVNPALWAVDVPLDSLTPMNGAHYRVLDNGEAEYTGWISTRVLNTNVAVKLPFRVDIEFRVDENSAGFRYGSDEGSIIFYHGTYLTNVFGVNMENHADEILWREAVCFHQPIFGDYYQLPKRGKIKRNDYNHLTWIVGEKHFAVILNGEVRYCCANFPYMAMDLSRTEARPMVIGSNGQAMKYFRSIRVTQLSFTPKNRIKVGELSMITKRSNNIIPSIHRFITSEHGENYWFNGCGRYVMGALGEKDYDYEFFAGVTGDVFAQVYPYDRFRGDGVTDFMLGTPAGIRFVEDVFDKCGYAATFVPEKQLKANREMYLQTLMAYIDKGVPVISNLGVKWHTAWTVFVGYEELGQTLLFMSDNMTEPERVSADDVFANKAEDSFESRGWLFVGEKLEQKDLARIYRDAIANLPKLLIVKTVYYCFGGEAFRAWASDIENGKFDGMKPEEFDGWTMYSTYVCIAATNGSCCFTFLDRALQLNPEFTFISEISAQYKKMGRMWERDSDGLEAIGGGFNITLATLQDREKRGRIAAKLREFAECADEVVRIVNDNLSI
ncbi:MAG: putative transcriptional regulator [Paenibacillaceae bacterium]|jgi:DNA-binding transcriptional MerR regulator|nr:putative transcriptional regulator [Paenibacillaceae bacterium]